MKFILDKQDKPISDLVTYLRESTILEVDKIIFLIKNFPPLEKTTAKHGYFFQAPSTFRRYVNGKPRGVVTIEKNRGHYKIDDIYDSEEIYENQQSVLITHSETDPVALTYGDWLKRVLLILLEPSSGPNDIYPTHISNLESSSLEIDTGSFSYLSKTLLSHGFEKISGIKLKFVATNSSDLGQILRLLISLRVPILASLCAESYIRHTKPREYCLQLHPGWHLIRYYKS